MIEKEGRLALNLSNCQKCPAVYIRHETGRKKKSKNEKNVCKVNKLSSLCKISIFCENSGARIRRVKEEAQCNGSENAQILRVK